MERLFISPWTDEESFHEGLLKDRCVCRNVEDRFASRVPEANPGCPALRPCNILEEPNPFFSMNFSLEGLNAVET